MSGYVPSDCSHAEKQPIRTTGDEVLCLQRFLSTLMNFWMINSFNAADEDEGLHGARERPPIFFLGLLQKNGVELDWQSMLNVIASQNLLQAGNL